MEKVIVIGHKNPDTDTVVASIAMAAFLNARDKTTAYEAHIPGSPNTETEYVFKRFNVKYPPELRHAGNSKLYLVDHNEMTQMVDGATNDSVVGIADHHKLNFSNSSPIEITTKPWGSTNSIVYDLFQKEAIGIPKQLKFLMLAAIVSDTVILKSPTTTDTDRKIVEALSRELELDYKVLGMEMFSAKAQISAKSAEQIIFNDFKDFDFSGRKTGIGQIEAPDLKEVESRITELKAKLLELKAKSGYHTMILMVTDIIQEGSKLLVVSETPQDIEKRFRTKLEGGLSAFIPGMMSRKKQVVPVLS